MANLLDRASVVLTPTAYNNGEALCIKPDDGSGDFTFSRNSAATRVNAQGLVENVQILSSNLVQNGDFSEEGVQEVSNGSFSQEGSELVTNGDFSSDTAWIKGTGTTISGGNANFVNADGVSLYQSIGNQSGFVKITFNVTDYTSGTLNVYSGGNQSVGIINVSANALGTYTAYVDRNGGNVNIIFGSSDNFIGSIDNCSVREVGQDWTLGTGWSIGEDKAERVSTGTYTPITQGGILTAGKFYKVTYTVNDGSVGGVRVQLGGTYAGDYNGAGTHTIYGVAGTSDFNNFKLVGEPSFNGSITNISVKEVGQNWVLVNATIGNDLVLLDADSGNSQITQSNLGSTNSTSKLITFTTISSSDEVNQILRVSQNIAGTSINIYTDDNGVNLSAIGVHKVTIPKDTSANDTLFVRLNSGANRVVSLSNFSVIEITDDTNLPRISYENFSYQDALGSEEIVNGTFSSDTAWNKASEVTIQNGAALFTLAPSGQQLSQSVNPTIGKQYKITYEIKSITQGAFDVSVGSDISTSYNNSVGVYTEYLTATSTNAFYIRSRGVTNGSIDNVSVKEYLGQEVVPDSGCGSWLWEPQSTNLITQSELFSDASWNQTTAQITSTNNINPSGNAGTFTIENIGSGSQLGASLSITSGASFSNSWYVRKISGTGNFDIKDTNNVSSSFTATDAWQRFSVTAVSSSTTGRCYLQVPTQGDIIEVWGAQLEALSYASSLIPTSGSQVTRNQDLCTNGGSLASINSTEGTLYFEFKQNSTDISVVSISDGSISNFIQIYIPFSASSLRYRATTSGVVQFDNQISTAIDLTLNHKYAIKWKLNNFSLWVDGIKINSQLIGSTPIGLNQINFYNVFGGGSKVNGKTKALAVWKEALTDAELTELTTI